jgi:hypothetical protein
MKRSGMRQQMVMSLLLLMGMLGIASNTVSQEPKVDSPELGTSQFLATDLLEFKIQDLDLESAVEKLRTAVAQQHARTVPAIGVIRYDGTPVTETNPWKMRESISLVLERSSAADVLHYLAEGAGFITSTDKWRIELYEVPVSTAYKAGSLSPNLQGALGVREFTKLRLPRFRCHEVTAQEAVQILRESAATVSGNRVPPVPVIRYRNPEDPPFVDGSKARAVSLDLEDVPAGEALRYVAELTGFRLEHRDTCIALCDIMSLYHPKVVRQFQLKKLEAVWGKAGKPVEKWLEKKLRDHGIPVSDPIGFNERTGQMFVATPPEYVGAILRGPANKTKDAIEAREARQKRPAR